MAVAITALMGGLVIAPVTQQSAEAQVYGGLRALNLNGDTPTSGTTNDRGDVILVGRGGGRGGGGHGGGGRHWGGGHGGGHVARGGGRGYGHGGRSYAHNWQHGGGGHNANKGPRTITPITITTAATTGTAATIGIIGGTEALTPMVTATAIAPGSAVRP